MPKSSHPWDIYSEQLLHLGYGYPLWNPDQPQRRSVLVGDVGMVREGEFIPLFNTLQDATSEIQPRRMVPTDFVPLPRDRLFIIGPREKIRQKMLCSGDTHESTVSIGAGLGK